MGWEVQFEELDGAGNAGKPKSVQGTLLITTLSCG
jgi:hypothetical protein